MSLPTFSLQPMQDDRYDVVIIGAGLGGLLSAVILAKEGKKVCVLEKNRQVGGCLQSFAFRKTVFDSCIHYIGGLAESHSLHHIFSYAGIMQGLRLQPLREEGFDRICFGYEEQSYPLATRSRFVEELLPFFPKEEAALERYLSIISRVAGQFPLYQLRGEGTDEKLATMGMELSATVQHLSSDPRFGRVLLGNAMLYAGAAGITPFYVHALTTDSYLHSAHKVLPATSQISKLLWRQLQAQGGVVHRHAQVSHLHEEHGRLAYAEIADGRRFYADHFIAAIHPATLFKMLDGPGLRPSLRRRVLSLPQTPPGLMINIVLRPGVVPYTANNIYWHPSGEVLAQQGPTGLVWPDTQSIFYNEDELRPGFAAAVTVLVYSRNEEYEGWEQTQNIEGVRHSRDRDYEAFKHAQAEAVLAKTYRRFPILKEAAVAHSVATPLSFRDYSGLEISSLYGPLKDASRPAQTLLGARTRIPNLMLTGQNLNMHGVMGVSISAVATCSEILGENFLLNRIRACS